MSVFCYHLYSQTDKGSISIVATRENRHTLRDVTVPVMARSTTFIRKCAMGTDTCVLCESEASRVKNPGGRPRKGGGRSRSTANIKRANRVIRLRKDGKTNTEIAQELGISKRVVEGLYYRWMDSPHNES